MVAAQLQQLQETRPQQLQPVAIVQRQPQPPAVQQQQQQQQAIRTQYNTSLFLYFLIQAIDAYVKIAY
jgi:hypothetical protein